MCINVLRACVFVNHMCACCPQKREEGFESPVFVLMAESHYVCLMGMEPGSSARATSALNLKEALQVPCLSIPKLLLVKEKKM